MVLALTVLALTVLDLKGCDMIDKRAICPFIFFINIQKGMYMQQAIIGFHLDEEQHWVADLACGHGQHVRHNPPWQNRPWVMTEQGRKEKLGVMLECKKCDEEHFL